MKISQVDRLGPSLAQERITERANDARLIGFAAVDDRGGFNRPNSARRFNHRRREGGALVGVKFVEVETS